MTPYVCSGVNSKMIYVEGSKAYINKALMLDFPTYEKRKIKGSTEFRETLVNPLFIEPLKIQRAGAYYADLDAEK